MALRTIEVFEHEELKVGKTYCGVKFHERDFDALARFNERFKQRYFRLIHNGIRTRSYVGVVQAGDLVLEILPKVDRKNNVGSSSEVKRPYRELLLHMLRRTGLLRIELTGVAAQRLKRFSLLDLYIETFLDEVLLLIRRGLTRSYSRRTSELNVIKGRISFSRQIRLNHSRAEKVWCDHQNYATAHPINLILNEALQVLQRQGVSPLLQSKLKKVQLDFPELPGSRTSPTHLNRIVLDRKTVHYEKAFAIAKLILQNNSPNFAAGDVQVLALLFDMEELWEKYVFRELHRNQARLNYKVKAQPGRRFWETKLIRPDILLTVRKQNFIIDTKWKLLEELSPSDADLKQMFVYNQYFDARKALLLYPASASPGSRHGEFHGFSVGETKREGMYCSLGMVSPCRSSPKKGVEINSAISDEICSLLGEPGCGE